MHFGSSTSELCCTNRHLTKTSDIVVKLSQCAFNTLTFKLLMVLLNNEKNYGFSEAHDFWLENYGCSEDCYWLDLSVWVFLYPVSCDQFSIFGLCMRLKFAEYLMTVLILSSLFSGLWADSSPRSPHSQNLPVKLSSYYLTKFDSNLFDLYFSVQ